MRWKTRFSYGSAVAIILMLITCAQIAIQLTLRAEIDTRETATLLNRLELRTQRILRSSLLLLAPNPMDPTINPLRVDPASQLTSDLVFVQQTQETLAQRETSIGVQIRALSKDYQAMEGSGHSLLAAYTKKDKKSMVTYLRPLFEHEQKYLTGIFMTWTSLTQQADDLVNSVRVLELVIYVASLLVVAYEVFGIVRPTEKAREDEIRTLRSLVLTLQEAAHIQRQSKKKEGGEEHGNVD